MKTLRLVIGSVNDKPLGGGDERCEEVYQRALKPYLSALNSSPALSAVLHYSGCLLEWLEADHPEYIMLLQEMVKRKQVELLGGGFYEPILSLIPDSDKLGQIEKLTTYLRSTFGTRPRGAWLTGRVWEPGLARILNTSGLDYTFLDDRFFQISGLEEGKLYFPYVTEEQGKTITVFPLGTGQAGIIPAQKPQKLIEALKPLADESGRRILTLLVEGERFSSPESAAWLKDFFRALEDNVEWLPTVTPPAYLREHSPGGKLYFCCLSSEEMMRWALPNARQRGYQELNRKLRPTPQLGLFLMGGYFRQFLTKYPEVNLLYSRMLHTHIRVNQVRGDKYRKMAARNELWKAQAHRAYWHGVVGGAYSNPDRKDAYRCLIEAERIIRASEKVSPSIICTDFDMDGGEEFLYQGNILNGYVHRLGGSIFELDYLPAGWNYLDTFSRWSEPYHQSAAQGCDWYPRQCFLDHFFAPDAEIESFNSMTYRELGNFIGQPFSMLELKRDAGRLILERSGRLNTPRGGAALAIRKEYLFKENTVRLTCILRNGTGKSLDLWYGLEVNLALASNSRQSARILGSLKNRQVEVEGDKPWSGQLESIQVQDLCNKTLITLIPSRAFGLWSLPVETVSRTPAGMQKSYQSSCLVLHWKLSLAAQESWEVGLSLNVKAQE